MYTYLKKLFRSAVFVLIFAAALFASAYCAEAQSVSQDEYGSYDEAVTALRAGLVEREEEITVYFRSETELPALYYMDMFYDDGLAHTGMPKEGDYIRANLHGCIYSHSVTQGDDGAWYYTTTFMPEWLSTAEMEAEVDAAVAALLDELDLYGESEYRKIRGVYDYICEYIKYDYDNEYIDTYLKKHTTYAAIIDKVAVCQGYASLFYRLMLELGVDCRYISGDSQGEHHGWNIVRIGDVYYNVDSTWDAGITVYYRYFLCTEANFPHHVRDSQYSTTEFMAVYPMAELPYVEHVAASGTTGALKWVLDGESGILTIGGTGAMPDYQNLGAPWFPYADNISGIVIEEGVTSVGKYAFVRCKVASSVSLPSTLTRIGEYGFNNCRALQTVELPEGLVSMGHSAFGECTALKSIVIPGTVTSFGSSIFSNCHNLASVTFAEGMKNIPNSMFYNADGLKSVSFPSSLVSIGNTAFRDCDNLTSVTVPAHVTSLGAAVFANCKRMQNIYVDDANPNYSDIGGVLFNKAQDTLITYPAGRYGSYTIPSGTKTIGYAAFAAAIYLTSVSVPESVTVYEYYAFAWCERLSSVVVGANVTSVGDDGFAFCSALKSITFLNPDTTIGHSCFSNCRNLTNVSLPSRLTKLETSTFWQCDKLKSITLPSTLKSIGNGCFQDCDLIESITVPASVNTLGRAFYQMPKLKEIYILGSINSVERETFASSTKLEFVYLGGGFRGVDSTAFNNCPGMKCVYFSDAATAKAVYSATSLGGACANVKSVAVPLGTTGLSSYLTNKLPYSTTVSYRGQEFHLYSDHSHSWLSGTTEKNGCITTQNYYCYYCSAKKQTESSGHSYAASVVYPTCTEQGYTTYTCSYCGDSYEGDYVDALGHSFGEWTELSAPSCYAEGRDERSCVSCGQMQLRDTRISGDPNKIMVSQPVEEGFYSGKKIVFIGDSITYGVGVENRSEEAYPHLIADLLDVTAVNLGVSGSGYCTGGRMATNKTLTEANISDADVITIMLGINDWAWSVKDGFWNGKPGYYDESDTYYQLGEYGNDDTSTFYGALKWWCESIVDLKQLDGFEEKQFVVITPMITSWNNSMGGVRDWNQDKTNVHGHTLRQYCTAIMEVCAEYGIPVFDANMFSGIYYRSAEDNNVAETGGDGVHVAAAGHALLAEALAEFLLEGYYYENREVAGCGHSFEETVTAPSCTEQGYTSYRCPDCHYGYIDSYVDALEHDYSAGLCIRCGEDGAELTEENGSVNLRIPGLGEDARVIAAFYSGERMLSCKFVPMTDGEAVFPAVDTAEVRVFVLGADWTPLRSVIK